MNTTEVCQGFFPSGAAYLIITKERQVLASAPYAPHRAYLKGAIPLPYLIHLGQIPLFPTAGHASGIP